MTTIATLSKPARRVVIEEQEVGTDYGTIRPSHVYLALGSNPINRVDPLGLAATQPAATATAPAVVEQSVLFIETDDFRLTGTLTIKLFFNIDHEPKGFETLTTPSMVTVFEMENNYYKSVLAPGDKKPTTLLIPKDAGKGFDNSMDIYLSAGTPIDLRVGNPIADMFLKDYALVEFKGKISTKEKCERIAGKATLTLDGDVTINGVKAVQKETTQVREFDFGDATAKTFIRDIKGSVSRRTTFDKADYVLFKIDGGSIKYKFSIEGKEYKK